MSQDEEYQHSRKEGVDQALKYVATQRPSILEKVKARDVAAREENRSDLLPLLKSAQLETERNHPAEAEHLFREILALEPDWSEPRNAFAWFLIQRGEVIEPAQGNAKLREAVQICQGTLALNPREKSPQDWARTQNNLGNALQELGTRSGGEEGRKLLGEAVAAYRSALEVYTKADLPQYWAMTQNNLSLALWDLGSQLEGKEGLNTQRESVDLLREVVSYQPDDVSRYRLAFALGGLAFHLVLDSQFAEAQTRCQEAQRLANEIGDGVQKSYRDNLIFIQGNLAHALLFQGHYDEALAIYRQYWDKPLHGKTLGGVTLEDFAAFDKAGLTHPDLSRMKQALSDLTSKSPSP
jgi:tetratricopeptide (TPR) repeat protein